MGVRQSDYNSSRGMELLKLALMEREQNNTPGRTPSAMAQNAYFSSMPNTDEQEREAASYDDINAGRDARYEARQNANTSEDIATSGARAHGFPGGIPEQDASAKRDALQKLILPAQIKAQGDRQQEAFDAEQHGLDRASREGIAARATAGSMDRLNTTQAAIAARQPDKRFGIAKLWDMMTGGKQASSAAPTPASGGTVKVQTPSGDIVSVPASELQDAIANGAVPVN